MRDDLEHIFTELDGKWSKLKVGSFLEVKSSDKVTRIDGEGDLRSEIYIEWGQMYGHPNLSFKIMKALSELFGTDDITSEMYSLEGCDTCDYGSHYGHNITIKNVTRNFDGVDGVYADQRD